MVGDEEQEKQGRGGLGKLNTSPNDGLCGGSTIDLTAGRMIDLTTGSTIDLGPLSSVDLEETSCEQGSRPVPANADTARGDGSCFGTSRNDTTNSSNEKNGRDEGTRDIVQDCRLGLQRGTAAKRTEATENDPGEDGQEEGKGGMESDGGHGVDNLARSDSAGGVAGVAGDAGAAATGSVQSVSWDLKQVVARTNNGGRRRVGDGDVGDKGSNGGGGGQRAHRQRTRDHGGSSAKPSVTNVIAPSGNGPRRKEQDLRGAAFEDSGNVG